MKKFDIIIIGGGPAGLAAGLQAAHLGLAHLVIERPEPASRLPLARWVENFPQVRASGIPGDRLYRALWAQALKKGVAIKRGAARSVAKAERGFMVGTEWGRLVSQTVILATGLVPQKLAKSIAGPQLEKVRLFYRWTDVPFLKGKRKVLVIGGGEAAFDQACSLAGKGFEVTVAIRGQNDKVFHSLRREAGELGVSISYDTSIKRLSETKDGLMASLKIAGKLIEGQYDHCLAAIGGTRNVPVLSSGARQCAGIYLAGDAAHPKIKQAAVAFGDGIRKTMEAYEHIRNNGK